MPVYRSHRRATINKQLEPQVATAEVQQRTGHPLPGLYPFVEEPPDLAFTAKLDTGSWAPAHGAGRHYQERFGL
jgi:hypothetical protein